MSGVSRSIGGWDRGWLSVSVGGELGRFCGIGRVAEGVAVVAAGVAEMNRN